MVEEGERELGDMRRELEEMSTLRTDLERALRDNVDRRRQLE